MTKRAKKDQDTAPRILEAADELFCSRGYEGVSIGDIADRAGAGKALVFYHFGDKEKLFERVLERYYEAHRAALAGVYEAEGTRRERLHRMVDAYLDFMIRNRRYAALIQQQVADPRTHPLIARLMSPFFQWIEQVLLEIAPAQGPLAARQFYVTFSGMVINYFTYAPLLEGLWGANPLAPQGLDERRQHVHWMVDRVLDGLGDRPH